LVTDANNSIVDAETLFKAGRQRFGTDATKFFEIMAKQNAAQLCELIEQYEKLARHTIYEEIEIDTDVNFPVINYLLPIQGVWKVLSLFCFVICLRQ
jgi:hypothetical protein